MNLLRITHSDRPSRFYVDGRRVSRDAYYDRIDEQARAGRLQNSFTSRTNYDRHGRAIRREWSSI